MFGFLQSHEDLNADWLGAAHPFTQNQDFLPWRCLIILKIRHAGFVRCVQIVTSPNKKSGGTWTCNLQVRTHFQTVASIFIFPFRLIAARLARGCFWSRPLLMKPMLKVKVLQPMEEHLILNCQLSTVCLKNKVTKESLIWWCLVFQLSISFRGLQY